MRTMTAVVYRPTTFDNGGMYRAEIRLDNVPQDEWHEDTESLTGAREAAEALLGDITASNDEYGNPVLNDGEIVINKGVIVL